jgi:hypothetical protein
VEPDLEQACSAIVLLEIQASEKIMGRGTRRTQLCRAGKPRFNTANHNDRPNDYRPIDRYVPNRQIASCRDLSAVGDRVFFA